MTADDKSQHIADIYNYCVQTDCRLPATDLSYKAAATHSRLASSSSLSFSVDRPSLRRPEDHVTSRLRHRRNKQETNSVPSTRASTGATRREGNCSAESCESAPLRYRAAVRRCRREHEQSLSFFCHIIATSPARCRMPLDAKKLLPCTVFSAPGGRVSFTL